MPKRSVLIFLAVLFLCIGFTSDTSAHIRFVVFSDPHYYDSDLGTGGAAFEAYLQKDPKLLRESDALLRALMDMIITENAVEPIDFVIVPGDLTKDGELTSHQKFAAYLDQLESAGIAVFVVPGNHDVNNPHAYAYEEDTAVPVANVSPEQFTELYAPYGYGEAFSKDPGSLSYAVEPAPDLVLLGLDSCRYDENLALGEPETGGSFSPATLNWALTEIETAKAAGKKVLVFLHHGLMEHYTGQTESFADYVIDDWETVSQNLAAAGLKLAFSGHYHANDITQKKWDSDTTALFNVETGSLLTAPCPYRIVTLHGGNAAQIETRHVTRIDYDTGADSFPDYALNYLFQGLLDLAEYSLITEYQLSELQAEALAPMVADAFVAHYAGDEQIDAATLDTITAFLNDPEPKIRFIGQTLSALWRDLPPADNLALLPLDPTIRLTPIGSYATSIFDEGAAKIVAYDAKTRRLFVVNGAANSIDVLNGSDPTMPMPEFAIDLSCYGGGVNSVAVQKGIVAAAVEAHVKQDPGKVVFFNADTGEYLNQVYVGALPDMVTFTPSGRKVLVANEGEPNDDYTVDPEGSVTIIDISRGVKHPKVDTADFKPFNACKTQLVTAGVRIFGPDATVAQDLEPEYIAVAPNARFAWVSLQENNAVARLNLKTDRITHILPLGVKDHGAMENGLDASNKDGAIHITAYANLFGMFQPDALAAYRSKGGLYLVSANEGDVRDYDGFSEEARVRDLVLDPVAFPDAAALQEKESLGRLKVTNTLGDVDGDGAYEELYAFGARSFSIFKPSRKGIDLIFDSKDQLERITAAAFPDGFNADNDDNDSFDNRSDDKGPEPEGLTLGRIGAGTYLFLGLERIGGIMVYDISNPFSPDFVQYISTRDFSGDPENSTAGDLAPEGLIFIPANKSPNNKPLLVVAHEVSGSTTIFQIHVNCRSNPR